MGNVSPARILIIDDQPDNLNVLLGILRQVDYEVRALKSPAMALEKVTEIMPDLILLDIIMPEMDGIDFCRTLKENPETATIPIIFITALKFMEKKRLAFDSGGVDYITKPFETDEVLMRVSTHLQLSHLRRELHEMNTHLEQRLSEELKKRQGQEQLLIQQSKMASMGELLTFIGHQWVQPLSNISMTASILQSELRSEEHPLPEQCTGVLEDCQVILDSTRFMAQTLDHFKDFLHPSSAPTVFDLGETIKEVEILVGSALKKFEIELYVDDVEPISFRGYCNELKQVILNLIMNARDAISARQVSSGFIRVEFVLMPEKVIVNFSDNGGGIAAELLPEKLFQPYVSSKDSQGSGIGLYMSKTIIEYHMGGKLYADNSDQGAVFTIELPLSQ